MRAEAVRARLVGADRAQREPVAREAQDAARTRPRRPHDHDERDRDPAQRRLDRARDARPVEAARAVERRSSETPWIDDVGRERREHGREPEHAHERRVRETDEKRDPDHGEDAEHEPSDRSALRPRRTRSTTTTSPVSGPTERSMPPVSSTISWPSAMKHERAREQQHRREVELRQEAARSRAVVYAPSPSDQHREHDRRQVVAGGEAAGAQRTARARRQRSRALRVGRDRGAGDVLLGDLVARRACARSRRARTRAPGRRAPAARRRRRRATTTACPASAARAQHLVELEARAGVDAARRLVGQQDVGLGEQRAREQHLLLVAARERRDRRLDARRAHVELLDLVARRARPRARALHDARARRRVGSASSEVFSRTRERQEQALGVPVARQVDDARALRAARVAERHRLAARACTLALRGQQTGERAQELALPVALDAGEPDDLARPRHRGSTSWKRGPLSAAHAQQRRRRLGCDAGLRREDLLDRAADDEAQDLGLRDARRARPCRASRRRAAR